MKKLLINLFIIVLISLYQAALAEENISKPARIDPVAISDPLSLPVWYQFAPAGQIIIQTSPSVFRFIVPFVTPFVEKVSNILSSNPQNVQQQTNISTVPTNSDYQSYSPLIEHKEILYDIEFENFEKTPVFSDTVMFITISEGLRYTQNSFKLNNNKLSDKEDKDELTYINKEALLRVDLSKLNKKDKLNVLFSAKILDKNKIENNPFCFVKFESISNNIFTEWLSFP